MSPLSAYTRVFLKTSSAFFSTLPTGATKLPPGYNKPNAFSLYVQEHRKTGQPAYETVKDIAKTWNTLNESEKQSYREKAAQIGKERKSNFEALTEIERFKLRDLQMTEKVRQLSRLRRKYLHEHSEKTNRPKRPGNAYTLFVTDMFKDEATANMSSNERFALAARNWMKMKESEKEKYKAMSKEKMKEYQDRLEAWKKEQGIDASHGSNASKELLQRVKKLQLKL